MCKINKLAMIIIAKKQINTLTTAELFNNSNTVSKQHGITLIMVLIFIVTLSLVAAVGMRGVITGERVVANERDRAIAFQGAESAGRVAIELINTKSTSNFHARPPFPLGGNIEHWRTTSSLNSSKCNVALAEASTHRYDWSTDWSTAKPECSVKTPEKYDNKEAPRYVIEAMPSFKNAGNKRECWYRVTSRASGPTGEADVILQVMYSVEIPWTAAVDNCAKD
jgi:type IV pilus assembly protein PilX